MASEKPTKFVFEGAIKNFPSPESDKDNVNYLAGVREIGVRSEYTDGRDMPRLAIRVGGVRRALLRRRGRRSRTRTSLSISTGRTICQAYGRKIIHDFATRAYRRPVTNAEEAALTGVFQKSLA